ncbi:MAG: hypothetical protein FWE64_00160 [Alphaproteobacteria bacterium]|nr:hypothetical protein [Alphaproteobacteria bacterium]
MLNNRKHLIAALCAALFAMPASAEFDFDDFLDVDVLAGPTVPVFQQIADLEQERILLQLEKEKMQLVLDLDRMAVEQARLRADEDRLSGHADEEVRRLEIENQRITREKERLVDQNERLEERLREAREQRQEPREQPVAAARQAEAEETERVPIAQRFRLLEIVGAGRQLQATVEDLSNGQRRRVWVGRGIDGYDIKSVSLDDGVVFVKDGVAESLTMASGR